MRETNLKNNIKYLRKFYGETLLDLAYSLGLKSGSTIRNYEKGIRTPRKDLKSKIAAHYRITVDELEFGDFSNLQNLKISSFMKKYEKDPISLFRIITSEKAIKSKYFEKAYVAQKRVFNDINRKHTCNTDDITESIRMYIEAYGKDNVFESVANLLCWYLIFEICAKNEEIFGSIKCFTDSQAQENILLNPKEWYLRDMGEEPLDEYFFKVPQNEIDNIEETVIETAKLLKTKTAYSDLADYYMAIRYIMGCANNSRSDSLNRAFGEEMLAMLCEFGNKYANSIVNGVSLT